MPNMKCIRGKSRPFACIYRFSGTILFLAIPIEQSDTNLKIYQGQKFHVLVYVCTCLLW